MIKLPSWPLDLVAFEQICPSPSALLVDEYAGKVFARIGEGQSDCGPCGQLLWVSWMPVQRRLSWSDASRRAAVCLFTRRLVGFVTYLDYEDQSSVIIKLESVATVSSHQEDTLIGVSSGGTVLALKVSLVLDRKSVV